jgi:hypothetical protein
MFPGTGGPGTNRNSYPFLGEVRNRSSRKTGALAG